MEDDSRPPPLEPDPSVPVSQFNVVDEEWKSQSKTLEENDWTEGAKCYEMSRKVRRVIKVTFAYIRQTPNFRDAVGTQIERIRAWLYDSYPKAVKPFGSGMSLADMLWLCVAYLLHIDKTEAVFIGKTNEQIRVSLDAIHPTPSREQLIAALEKRLRILLCGFHHPQSIKLTPDFALLNGVDDLSNVKDQMRLEKEREEKKRRQDNPQDYEHAEEAPLPTFYDEQVDMDDLTDVEAFAFNIPRGDLEYYCAALITSSEQCHLPFITLCSRYFTWCGFRKVLFALYPITPQSQFGAQYGVPKQIDDMTLEYEKWVKGTLKYDQGIDFNRKFRDMMWQIFMPGGCSEYYRSVYGKLRAECDQVYLKFKFGLDALDETGKLADAAIATLTSRLKKLKPEAVLMGEDPGYRDLYCFFQFTYMFFHYVDRTPFLTEFVYLPDSVHTRRKDFMKHVRHLLPPRLSRPRIIIFGGAIIVQHLTQYFECQSLMKAALLWVWLVKAYYGDELANGTSIALISKALIPGSIRKPPEGPLPDVILKQLELPVALRFPEPDAIADVAPPTPPQPAAQQPRPDEPMSPVPSPPPSPPRPPPVPPAQHPPAPPPTPAPAPAPAPPPEPVPMPQSASAQGPRADLYYSAPTMRSALLSGLIFASMGLSSSITVGNTYHPGSPVNGNAALPAPSQPPPPPPPPAPPPPPPAVSSAAAYANYLNSVD